ncbi:MAG: GDP-L-fucose synthase [Candidatus Omnitrophota bacterium]|nr:GDP-L-fucose synthase [Candidatus Omnitrophota bacterium]
MEKNSLIYVAGHTGLIGSAIVRKLEPEGYRNIITRSRAELDLTDRPKTADFFAKEKPEYVFLAAAKVGGIYANSTYPAEFIYENLMIEANVIDLSFRCGVKKLIFLSSSCVYPKLCRQPMREDYIMTGALEPTNEPFGVAKLAGMEMCRAYNRQYKTNFVPVIAANVYGINDHLDESSHVAAALIRKFHEAKAKNEKDIVVWGSGRPKREFIYADDIADACLFLMNRYNSNEAINIGTGVETSIRELAGLIRDISGFEGKIIYDTAKPDGNPRRFLDTGKIRALGWLAATPLRKGTELTYNWYKDLEITAVSKR